MEEPTSETTLHCDSNELISDYFLKQTKSSRMSQWHKLLRKTRGIEVKLWKRSSEYPAISPDKRQFVCMQALQENERASERSNADTNLFLISSDDFAPFPPLPRSTILFTRIFTHLNASFSWQSRAFEGDQSQSECQGNSFFLYFPDFVLDKHAHELLRFLLEMETECIECLKNWRDNQGRKKATTEFWHAFFYPHNMRMDFRPRHIEEQINSLPISSKGPKEEKNLGGGKNQRKA